MGSPFVAFVLIDRLILDHICHKEWSSLCTLSLSLFSSFSLSSLCNCFPFVLCHSVLSLCLFLLFLRFLPILITIYQPTNLSVCLPVCLCLCVCQFARPPARPPACLPACLSVCLSVCLCIYFAISQSAYRPLYLSTHISIYLSIHLSIYSCIHLSIYLSNASLYLAVYSIPQAAEEKNKNKTKTTFSSALFCC